MQNQELVQSRWNKGILSTLKIQTPNKSHPCYHSYTSPPTNYQSAALSISLNFKLQLLIPPRKIMIVQLHYACLYTILAYVQLFTKKT